MIRAEELFVLVRLSRSKASFAGKHDTVLSLVGTESTVDDAVVALESF